MKSGTVLSSVLLGASLFLADPVVAATMPQASRARAPVVVLSPAQAAVLAATLANDQCHQLYGVRPFRPFDSGVTTDQGRYRWGGLDVRGINGFSAFVTFELNGAEPFVEVYYSTDANELMDEDKT